MAVQQLATRYAKRRIIRRAGTSIPWIGIAFAAVAVASAVRRKGLLHGALDSALNAIPFVGSMKNAAEVMRGRDFFPDRSPRPSRLPRHV